MSQSYKPSRRVAKTVPLFAQIDSLNAQLAAANVDTTAALFGATAPNAVELEAVAIAACLVDAAAFPVVSEILKADDFYNEFHADIFAAMVELKAKNAPIDVETVSRVFLDAKRTSEIYDIVTLSNRAANGTNVEYHARIIYQKSKLRGLIADCTETIRTAYNGQTDVFDLCDSLNAKTRVSNPKSVLRTMTMNEALQIGKKEPVRKQLIGGLIREGDVAILFGDAGTGKSGLAVQIGLSAANGKPMFNDAAMFPNLVAPTKTLFVDLELETRELFDRYSESDMAFDFGENFYRADLNPDCFDIEDGGEKIIRALSNIIEKEKPKFVIVDNITWLTSESQDAAVATAFMKTLLKLRRVHDLTILVIAHTPKRNTTEPITANHLAGSKNLVNFAKTLIAVAPSALDSQIKYIKHLKSRNGMIDFNQENVIKCVLDKPVGSAFLEWKFMGTGDESEHLTKPNLEMTEDEICAEAIRLQKDLGIGLERVIIEMSLPFSRVTLLRKIKLYQERQAVADDFTDFVKK